MYTDTDMPTPRNYKLIRILPTSIRESRLVLLDKVRYYGDMHDF